MKKILLMLALMLPCLGAWAQMPKTSDAPSDGNWAANTKWYTIKNAGSKFVSPANADANGYFKLNSTTMSGLADLWCVVGSEETGYQFYNLLSGPTKVLGAYGSQQNGRMKMYDLETTTDGSNTLTKSFDIKTISGQTGYAFVRNHGENDDWWNERNGYLAYWNVSGAFSTGISGSQFTFTEVDLETYISQDYKNQVLSTLAIWKQLDKVFNVEKIAEIEEEVNAMGGTPSEFTRIEGLLNELFVTGEHDIDNILFFAKVAETDGRAGHYLTVDPSNKKCYGVNKVTFNGAWSLKHLGATKIAIFNPINNLYLGLPGANGLLSETPVVYTLSLNNGNVVFKAEGQTLHMNNHTSYIIGNAEEKWLGSQWTLDFETIENKQALKNDWETLKTNFANAYINVPVGLAKIVDTDSYNAVLPAYDGIMEDESTDAYMMVQNAMSFNLFAYSLPKQVNAPEVGKFYRLKNEASSKLLNGAGKLIDYEEGKTLSSTIFYLEGDNFLLSYADGLYYGVQNRGYGEVGKTYGGAFHYASGGAKANVIAYQNQNNYLYGKGNTNNGNADRGSSLPANDNGYNWTLEEVTEIPVKISAAKYASFYTPVTMTVPEDEGITAYCIKSSKVVGNETWANLEEIEGGVIPAGTGVILYADVEEATTFNLTVGGEATYNTTGNWLTGTAASAYIEDNSYVLSNKYGIGLYLADKNQEGNTWLNNGFKAYLPVDNAETTSGVLRFNFGGTTAIESVLNNSADANAPIYDLSGRRVMNTVKGGIYIQNGKKFIVK